MEAHVGAPADPPPPPPPPPPQVAAAIALGVIVGVQLDHPGAGWVVPGGGGTGAHPSTCALDWGGAGACNYSYAAAAVGVLLSLVVIGAQVSAA